MKLYINTTNAEKIIVGIDGVMNETKAREDKSQKLLIFIDELLKKHNKKINDITEIEINNGEGSFTGKRVGLSVANTIAWVLDIPCNLS